MASGAKPRDTAGEAAKRGVPEMVVIAEGLKNGWEDEKVKEALRRGQGLPTGFYLPSPYGNTPDVGDGGEPTGPGGDDNPGSPRAGT